MLKKFIEWLKKLFKSKDKQSPLGEFVDQHPEATQEMKQSSSGVMFDYQKHKYINFLASPVMYFPKEASDPFIGFVRQLDLVGKDNEPAVVFFDYINNVNTVVTGNFRLFSQKVLKEAMELHTRDRLEYLYPERKEDFETIANEPGPSTYEEIVEKLEKGAFYDTAYTFFKMDPRQT